VAGGNPELTGGRLNRALVNAAVQQHREVTGHGPSKAQAFHRDNVVVVLMWGALTLGERNLAAMGRAEAVRYMRDQLRDSMRAALVEAIERLTGIKVNAFLGDTNVESEVTAMLFVLDRPITEPNENAPPA
jgi:uncharacterized protein YbcI